MVQPDAIDRRFRDGGLGGRPPRHGRPGRRTASRGPCRRTQRDVQHALERRRRSKRARVKGADALLGRGAIRSGSLARARDADRSRPTNVRTPRPNAAPRPTAVACASGSRDSRACDGLRVELRHLVSRAPRCDRETRGADPRRASPLLAVLRGRSAAHASGLIGPGVAPSVTARTASARVAIPTRSARRSAACSAASGVRGTTCRSTREGTADISRSSARAHDAARVRPASGRTRLAASCRHPHQGNVLRSTPVVPSAPGWATDSTKRPPQGSCRNEARDARIGCGRGSPLRPGRCGSFMTRSSCSRGGRRTGLTD
jgi:hypothetical protein